MSIIETAKHFQKQGIGSMSPNTLVRYHEIYQKFLFYKRFHKTMVCYEKVSMFCFCSEELARKVVQIGRRLNW